MMPSGERSIQGLTMVIQHADRHSAGQYQCSADNGVGEPDTKHININVLCKCLMQLGKVQKKRRNIQDDCSQTYRQNTGLRRRGVN